MDVRDTGLRRVGRVDAYTQLDVVVRHLDVGTWSLTLPADHPQARLLAQGSGVAIWAEGAAEPLLTGPVRTVRDEWSASTGDAGQLTFTGACDNAHLAARLAFPDPARAPDTGNGRYSVEHWVRSGPAGDIIRELVAANTGETALASRRVDRLSTDGVPAGLGASTVARLRFDTVMTAVRDLATGAGLSARVAQTTAGGPLELQVAPVRDLRRTVRLSPRLGNLSAYSYQLTAPTATRAVVAAQGKGTDRFFWQWSAPDDEREWSRAVETFVDQRDTPVPARLDDSDAQFKSLREAASRALEQGGQQAELSLTPIDTPTMRYGVDYQVGDTVTVTTSAGRDLAYPVREVHLTDGPEETRIQATVGSDTATRAPALYAQVRRLWQAVHHLNTRH